MDIVFCDLETSGLDPQRHAAWDFALIKGTEELTAAFHLEPNELRVAEPMALKVNHYYERKDLLSIDEVYDTADIPRWRNPREEFALKVARFTNGCILAGNTVHFDQKFLEAWMRKHGACPTWDYHVLDVPTFAAGVLRAMGVDLNPPFKSSSISQELQVPEPEGGDKHTALADARWAKNVYIKALKQARNL